MTTDLSRRQRNRGDTDLASRESVQAVAEPWNSARMHRDGAETLIEAARRILESEVDAVMWASCLHESFRGGKRSPLQIAKTDEGGLLEALRYLESQRSVLARYGWTGRPAVHWKDQGCR